MDREANKQTVADFMANWSDLEYFTRATTDDFEWVVEADPTVNPAARIWTRDEIAERFRVANERMDGGVTMTVKGMVAEGSQVAVQAVGTGARGVRADQGTVFCNRYHFLVDLQGEKLRRLTVYQDTAYLRAYKGDWPSQS